MMFNINEVLSQLTLEEKASLCSGLDFWHLRGIPRLNVPSIMLTDGPHGLRKQTASPDHIGISSSHPATCFPPAVTLASTWNPQRAYDMGVALGEECRTQGVSVLLGPGMNIKRHPFCGRNFEYFSEDPLLSGVFASSWIQGVQSQGIGTSLKHFALNNQESMRMVVDTIVDERTMHEIYLKGFKHAIQESQPWTIMSAYNKVNGHYMSEHPTLLNPLLRDTWGFKGAVITDWGANHHREAGLKAGQDIEMPGGYQHQIDVIRDAVLNKSLSMDVLDTRVRTILELIQKASTTLENNYPDYSIENHHQLARAIGAEGIVLLKNEGETLPIKKQQRIAVIGELAQRPRYQGSGSSLINPHQLSSLLEALSNRNIDYNYARGYDLDSDEIQPLLLNEAKDLASDADVVVCMVGLPDRYESEGFDRQHLHLPHNHIVLIEALCAVHSKVIVCLSNGAPVLMPWRHVPSAILEAYLGGQASGEALLDVLIGDVNPSGKLAETFPEDIEDVLSHHYFPGEHKQVEYREGPYVGYRWFSSANIRPAYPFGYGLSYSTFNIDSLKIDLKDDIIQIHGELTNNSHIDGYETIQIYVSKPDSVLIRPKRSLVGFKKIWTLKHQSQPFTIDVDVKQLKIFQGEDKLEAGEYVVSVGTSSEDIIQSYTISLSSQDKIDSDLALAYFNPKEDFKPNDEDFALLLNRPIPQPKPLKPYTINSTLVDISAHPLGKMMLWGVLKMSKSLSQGVADEFNQAMIEHMIKEMPLRSLINFSGGKLSMKTTLTLLSIMNKGLIKTLIKGKD
jgi:beta-glucosidase